MNNSQLFKQAHKKARLTVDTVGDYQIAFTLALRELIAENKKPVKVQLLDSESLSVKFGLIVWIVASVCLFASMNIIGMLSALVISGVVGIVLYFLCEVSNAVTMRMLKRKYKIVSGTPFCNTLQCYN